MHNNLTTNDDGFEDRDDSIERGDWLERQLTQQAGFLASLPQDVASIDRPGDRDGSSIPSVYRLRERTLKQRERRARMLSFTSSAVVLFSIVGWGINSFRTDTSAGLGAIGIDGELATISPVSNRQSTGSDPSSGQFQMVARWWEPVTIEWVDANGASLGVAGVVAEERMSKVDPSKLSQEQLQLIQTYLSESQTDQAANHFSSSLEPTF